MEPTSSAQPAELARYGRVGAAAAARIEAEARHLEAALGPFFARCSEYRVAGAVGLVPRLVAHGRGEGELGAWADGVGRGFMRADAGNSFAALSPRPLNLSASLAQARWNGEARQMIVLARIVRQAIRINGLAGLPAMLPAILPAGLFSLAKIELLSLTGEGSPTRTGRPSNPAEAIAQLLQGFWIESMAHIDPGLFRALAAEIDALNLAVADELGNGSGEPRAPEQGERIVDPRTGALDVTAAQAFPWSGVCGAGRPAPFRPGPADAMAGDHSAISYFPGEQVRLERLNEASGDYRVSIAGLNPRAPQSLNNVEAVAMTAQGIGAGNPYYEQVKARLLDDVKRLPSGSTLHMEGHSMGGGMCFLLREDPEVLAALAAAGVTVGSVITYGAVRPEGPAGKPRTTSSGPFAGAEERHYVNTDDALARNVGAGHAGDPNVIMLDNGQLDEPTSAHSGYGELENYSGLTPEQLAMPYLVDPNSYLAYGPLPQPQGPAPEPTVGPTPAPGPVPTPSPTPTAPARATIGPGPAPMAAPIPTPTPTAMP